MIELSGQDRSAASTEHGVSWGVKLPNCGGVLCPPDWATPANILSLAAAAAELGFDSVWLHDHLVTPAELRHLTPSFYEPLATMGAIASAHPNLNVGVATIILPLRDPVLLAKQIGSLAAFYPGRLLIGLGAGRYASEFEALGLDTFGRRGPVSEENLEIVRALLTLPDVSHSGATRTLDHVSLNPQPLPRPPLLYAGNAPVAAKRAARLADGWIGASMPAPELLATVRLMEGVRADLGLNDPFQIAYSATVVREDVRAKPGSPSEKVEELHLHASALTGDAEGIRSQLREYIAAGVNLFQLSLRAQTLDELRDNMSWFATEVMPARDTQTATALA